MIRTSGASDVGADCWRRFCDGVLHSCKGRVLVPVILCAGEVAILQSSAARTSQYWLAIRLGMGSAKA